MAEEPSVVYGRLRESVHISGYSASRACDALEWLLEEDRWKSVGVGFADGNQFLSTIDLSEFRIDESRRKKLVKKIKEVTEASQRAIGKAMGVNASTVNRDLVADATNGTNDQQQIQQDQAVNVAGATILDQSGTEAAEQLRKRKEQKAKKAERKDEVVEEIRLDATAGKFHVLVVDPPWPMQKIERDVRPNQSGFEYPTLTIEEIKAYEYEGRQIRDFAAEHAHLFLWTTHKFLPSCFDVMEFWGFRYVCCFVWSKPGGFQPIGLPQYNCEFVLYGRRGTPSFEDTKDFFCCFDAPRREHSRKPDSFYDVVRRVTAEPRIDIFSREPREGFAQLGNQIEKYV